MMTVEELKEFVYADVERIMNKKPSDYLRGKVSGMFRMYRMMAESSGNFDRDAYFEALDEVLELF